MIDLALGPHAAAVAVNDALHRGEANAGAGKICRRVQPLEGAKELAGVSHVEARAVVADEKGNG